MKHISNAVEPTARILAQFFHRHATGIFREWALYPDMGSMTEPDWVEEHWPQFESYAESLVAMYHAAGVMLIDATQNHDHAQIEPADDVWLGKPGPMTADKFTTDVCSVIDTARADGIPAETLVRELEDMLGALRDRR